MSYDRIFASKWLEIKYFHEPVSNSFVFCFCFLPANVYIMFTLHDYDTRKLLIENYNQDIMAYIKKIMCKDLYWLY